MRNKLLIFTLIVASSNAMEGQPGFCGDPYSTFLSASLFVPSDITPTLDGDILPFGSHIIAAFEEDGQWKCAGFIQWNGFSSVMVINGADGILSGYQANQSYKFIAQLPDGCLVDSVAVVYDVSGIYTNPGVFGRGLEQAGVFSCRQPRLAGA
ncbi:MAG: hypothetical protein IPM82_20595 [Saprospiraceae bacterium]|nr:hypothetical protein [Saprospiraceae bacterium]